MLERGMKYKYFVSYAYRKGRFSKIRFGSDFIDTFCPLNEETFETYSKQIAKIEGVKELTILYYRQVVSPDQSEE